MLFSAYGYQYTNKYPKELSNEKIYETENAEGYELSEIKQEKIEGKRVNKINAKYDAEIAALEQTASPETEVEQSAREKVIGENFEDIIKQLTANPIMQGDEFIGKEKC